MSMDEWEGENEISMSLHKYVAFGNNPVNRIDANGYFAWGERISQLLKGIFNQYSLLHVKSIILKNYTSINNEKGMIGIEKIEWIGLDGTRLSTTIKDVKWIEMGTKENTIYDYEFPAPPGLFNVIVVPPTRKGFTIQIDNIYESGIFYHYGHKSEGCIIYNNKIGGDIFRIIHENKENQIKAELEVFDGRIFLEKLKRPLPYYSLNFSSNVL